MENSRGRHNESVDHFTLLQNTAERVLPFKLGSIISMDLWVVYYSFIYWGKRPLNEQEFSYHKKHETIILLWVVIFMCLVEAILVHILVAHWSITIAWIFTAISLYTAIQLLGIIKSIPRRPIAIENGKLKLRYGFISETSIPIDNISGIEQNFGNVDFGGQTCSLSPFGYFEGHNILINLKTNATLNRIYGISTTFRTIAFHVDDKNSFIKAIERIWVADHAD